MLDRARWYARPRVAARAGPVRRALALGLLACALVSRARAREPAVFVQLPADLSAPAAAQLLSALEAQLADLAEITTQPGAADATCALSITHTPEGLLIEFVGAPASAAQRLVAGAPGELAASEVASIVRAFVVARLESTRAPASAADVPPPSAAADASSEAVPTALSAQLTPPRSANDKAALPGSRAPVAVDSPPTASAAPWRLQLAVAYTGTTYAQDLPWQSGLRVDASARLSALFYAGASYGYYVPSDVLTPDVTIRVSSHTLTGFAGLGHSWRSFGLALDAALGFSDTARETVHVAQGLERMEDSTRFTFLAALRLHGRMRFAGAPRLALDLAPAMEFAPSPGDSVVDAFEIPVLSPRVLRARVDLGASFDIL